MVIVNRPENPSGGQILDASTKRTQLSLYLEGNIKVEFIPEEVRVSGKCLTFKSYQPIIDGVESTKGLYKGHLYLEIGAGTFELLEIIGSGGYLE